MCTPATPEEMKQYSTTIDAHSMYCSPQKLFMQYYVELSDDLLSAKSFKDEASFSQVRQYCTTAESDLRKGFAFTLVVKYRVFDTLIHLLRFENVIERSDTRTCICDALARIKANDVRNHFSSTTISQESKEELIKLYSDIVKSLQSQGEELERKAADILIAAKDGLENPKKNITTPTNWTSKLLKRLL
ncbi:hypothetical protein GQ42DRAFT_5722 [Ramicandelaber brevisporus]|nr:hypothetical protein GQ42DRAFT_5722 [Ramicandelaber brevisporus]